MMRISNGFRAASGWPMPPSVRARLGRVLDAAAGLARHWRERARSRRALLALDEHALRDIGVSRAAARREGELPFWR
jgi:uncharacterized protein YjiS (DUF1127 family)